MTVSSRRQNDHQCSRNTLSTLNQADEINENVTICANDILIDCCEELTIAMIASSLEQKITTCGRFECSCQFVLLRNEKANDLSTSKAFLPPCLSTLHVCKVTSICFIKCRNRINFNYEFLVQNILELIEFGSMFSNYFECDLNHKVGFIKYIVEEFIRLQATYIAKNLTLVEQKILCRKQLNKKIHFLGVYVILFYYFLDTGNR